MKDNHLNKPDLQDVTCGSVTMLNLIVIYDTPGGTADRCPV